MPVPRRRPFLKAFACAAAAFVLLTAALPAAHGGPADAAKVMGHTLGVALVPALVTGLWERWSAAAWPLWRSVLTYIVVLVVVAALQAAGRGGTAAADGAAKAAFTVAVTAAAAPI